MKRMLEHKKKNVKKMIIFYLVILIIIIYLFLTVGFKILINSSIFISNFFPKKQTTKLLKNENLYGSINIDDIPVATNSARFIVSGSIVNYNILNFFINEEKVRQEKIMSGDFFSQEIGDLEKGKNEIYIEALSDDGQSSKKTNVYTVIFDDEKPTLEISSPQDKTTVNNQEIILKGKTDNEIYIKINEIPVVVDATGNFSTPIRLKDGDNNIVVIAEDVAGNRETKNLIVTYKKDE